MAIETIPLGQVNVWLKTLFGEDYQRVEELAAAYMLRTNLDPAKVELVITQKFVKEGELDFPSLVHIYRFREIGKE